MLLVLFQLNYRFVSLLNMFTAGKAQTVFFFVFSFCWLFILVYDLHKHFFTSLWLSSCRPVFSTYWQVEQAWAIIMWTEYISWVLSTALSIRYTHTEISSEFPWILCYYLTKRMTMKPWTVEMWRNIIVVTVLLFNRTRWGMT